MRKIVGIVGLMLCLSLYAQAQSIGALKQRLQQPSSGEGKVTIVEHGTAASAVNAVPGSSEGKVRGYRVRIFFDNSQSARSAAQVAERKFQELYPGIATYLVYDNPYFKVTVGNCLTSEEAIVLWGKIKTHFDRAFVVREEIPLSLFSNESNSVQPTEIKEE
ncbi:MAG: hypothetical protein PHV49_03300 [Alistipes sp.]|nr:hypothetical protein [Alistipes sp.]